MSNIVGILIAACTVVGIMVLTEKEYLFARFATQEVERLPFAEVIAQTKAANNDQRANAVIALGDYPENLAEAVPLLTSFLSRRSELDQQAAEFALEKMEPDAAEHVGSLAKARNPIELQSRCMAIGTIGHASEEQVEELVALLKNRRQVEKLLCLFGPGGNWGSCHACIGRMYQAA